MAKRRFTAKRGRKPNDSEMYYRGPIRLRHGGLDAKITRVNMSFSTDAVSSAGGKLDGAWLSNQATTSTDYASYANLYQEARVVAFEVRWHPLFNNTPSSILTPGIGSMAVYHTASVATPVSNDEVIQNPNHKLWNTGKELVMTWRARGTEEMQFNSVSGLSSHGGIQLYCDGASASQRLGQWILTFCVDFRGRK